MKYTRKDLSQTKIELTVKLDANDLADVRPAAVAKLSKSLKAPGFRPGKVPAKLAEKYLDPVKLENQVLENAVNKFLIKAIEDEKVRVLDRPQVEITEFEPSEKLEITASVEILPVVKLGDYKKLKVKKEAKKVIKSDIEAVIDQMRRGFSDKKEVERQAKDADEVWIDFDGFDEKGESVAGASGKDYPLVLGSSSFIPGFEDGLIGHKKDDTFDLPLVFPKDYHHAPLAGAKVSFKVTVKKVNEVVLPEVDDEFAKKCGDFKDLKEYQEDVKNELQAQHERQALDKFKDDLVEKLIEVSDVPVPEILLNDQIDSIERDTTQNLRYRGQSLEDYLKSIDKTRDQWCEDELKSAAERRVQAGLVLAELGQQEKINITKEELELRLQELINTNPNPDMRKYLETPESRASLANRVLTEKTVERLVELNS
jgi:trigger factor